MTLEDQVRALAESEHAAEQVRLAKATNDAQVKIVGALYDKSVAYTNLIVLGGYAFFFALWNNVKDHITPSQELLSALLLMISATFFVFWEVIKMIQGTHAINAWNSILQDEKVKNDPVELWKHLESFNVEQHRAHLRLVRFWHVQLVITVSTAVIGIAILAYAMVAGLISTYFGYHH